MAFEERIAGRLAHRQGDTILNMVTLSRSLDIPKAERSRNFSETDIISAKCSFSARTYLYRIFNKNYAKISRIAKNELFMSFSPQQR